MDFPLEERFLKVGAISIGKVMIYNFGEIHEENNT